VISAVGREVVEDMAESLKIVHTYEEDVVSLIKTLGCGVSNGGTRSGETRNRRGGGNAGLQMVQTLMTRPTLSSCEYIG
jgi:hypothetical protein